MYDLRELSGDGRLVLFVDDLPLDSGKLLGIVCHGPAAMLAATRPDGASPFVGYRLTGFTNAEET